MASGRTWAERRWRKADIGGEGEYALVAWCPRLVTVSLHETLEKAEADKRFIDTVGCGGQCGKDHEIVKKGQRSRRRGW